MFNGYSTEFSKYSVFSKRDYHNIIFIQLCPVVKLVINYWYLFHRILGNILWWMEYGLYQEVGDINSSPSHQLGLVIEIFGQVTQVLQTIISLSVK